MDKKPLNNKAVLIWRVRGLLFAIAGMFLSGGVLVFSAFGGMLCCAAVLIVFLLYSLIYVPLLYRSYRYNLNINTLTIVKGVLFKRTIAIEKCKVQYTEITQAPDQRICKTYTVNFYTAGAVVILDQLSRDEAEIIAKRLG